MGALVLAGCLFFLLLGFFRRSRKVRTLVENALGDDTPEDALRDFRLARSRLVRLRQTVQGLDPALAAEIDDALDVSKK